MFKRFETFLNPKFYLTICSVESDKQFLQFGIEVTMKKKMPHERRQNIGSTFSSYFHRQADNLLQCIYIYI